MTWQRKTRGGIVALIGYMLSPLSWWNDLFVNVPLALGFAWVISLLDKRAFMPSLVVGYWLTNVLGFILLHKGAQQVLSRTPKAYTRRDLLKDVSISLLYTLLIVLLVQFGVIKPIQSYFPKS
jgi:hypothetical protein